MRSKVRVLPLVGVMLVSMIATASVAAAPGSGCGMVITQSVTLTADIGPCGKGGIVIAADNISVDLGGHAIFGTSKSGDGAGVLLEGVTTSRVLNGTVRGFDAGVAIVGGSGHIVSRLSIRDNVGNLKGSRPAYGDGVVIVSSGGNWIFANEIFGNGPYGGISVIGTATGPAESNLIDRNRVVDNDIARAETNEDTGIRIEGPNALGNWIKGNKVLGNGFDGIAVVGTTGTSPAEFGTFIQDNVVTGNGFHNADNRKGDGIVLLESSDASLVSGNEVMANAANGIRVLSQTNRILGNDVLGNGLYPGQLTGVYDLQDENADCGDTEWASNLFEHANLSCIL